MDDRFKVGVFAIDASPPSAARWPTTGGGGRGEEEGGGGGGEVQGGGGGSGEGGKVVDAEAAGAGSGGVARPARNRPGTWAAPGDTIIVSWALGLRESSRPAPAEGLGLPALECPAGRFAACPPRMPRVEPAPDGDEGHQDVNPSTQDRGAARIWRDVSRPSPRLLGRRPAGLRAVPRQRPARARSCPGHACRSWSATCFTRSVRSTSRRARRGWPTSSSTCSSRGPSGSPRGRSTSSRSSRGGRPTPRPARTSRTTGSPSPPTAGSSPSRSRPTG